jgi:hypothetical protein
VLNKLSSGMLPPITTLLITKTIFGGMTIEDVHLADLCNEKTIIVKWLQGANLDLGRIGISINLLPPKYVGIKQEISYAR